MQPAEDADLISLLEHVLDAAIELQGADFGHVQLYDADNGTLRIAAHRGVGQEFLEYFACVDASDTTPDSAALKSGQRISIEDVTKDAAYAPHLGVADRAGYRGVNSVPITERGNGVLLGVLSTLFRKPYQPDQAHSRLSDISAAHAADLLNCHSAQAKLRENEEFLRLALEGAGMGTWQWDADTHLVKADAAHQAFFGMPPQERPLPNEVYWKLMDAEEEEIGTKRAQDALDQGQDIQIELRIHLPGGNTRWIAVRGRPHHDGSDSVIGISYDITERKERESALRENQEWLAAILDQVPGGIGLFDKDGNLILRGGSLGKLWSDVLPSLDATGANRWRGYHADGSPIAKRDYPGQRALRGEVVTPGLDFLHPDERGNDCWFRVSASPFRDDTGEIAGAVAYIQDIDKEKRAEERLRQSEEKLKSAVELAGLGLYSIEIKDGVDHLHWDDRVRRMWGLQADSEISYQVWQGSVHPDDLERVNAAVAAAYDPEGDGLYDVQYRVIGADGVERWVATRGETQFEDGRPVSFLGVALDITDRKMIEHGLELVIEMREGELEEVSASLEAEARAHDRATQRLELLQSELSRGLFAAIENRQRAAPSPRTHRRVTEAAREIAKLTSRERQVLDGLVRGEPHKTIAHRLGISVRTVEIHRTRMLHRLGTPHIAEAIRLAVLAELAAE